MTKPPDIPDFPDSPFGPVDEEHVRRERAKARELRRSQWWKNIRGRGRCEYCGQSVRPADLTMDHRVPVSRGGRSTRSNVVPCCKDCNTSKKHRVPVEWDGTLDSLPDNDDNDDNDDNEPTS